MSLFFVFTSILLGRYRQKNTGKSVGFRKKIKILRVSIERGEKPSPHYDVLCCNS